MSTTPLLLLLLVSLHHTFVIHCFTHLCAVSLYISRSSVVHACGRSGQFSKCSIVCGSSVQLHVVSSSQYPHLFILYLHLPTLVLSVVVVYPLPWPLLVGGVRCSRLWSTSQLLRPSGQQCSHSGGVCPQIQGRQCGAYVGAVEEMMCVVCVDVTEGA